MKKINILILVVTLGAVISSKGQDPNFSQYEVIKHYYNPAFTGDAKNIRAGFAYRNLWPNVPGISFPGPLSTYIAYMDLGLMWFRILKVKAFFVTRPVACFIPGIPLQKAL